MKHTFLEMFQELWQLFLGLGGTLLAWLLGRRKSRAELETIQISNVNELTEVYRKALADIQASTDRRIQELEKQIQDLKQDHDKEIKSLKDELEKCKKRAFG